MYRIGVIGDRDSVLGFQALGLEVCPVENAEEARQALHRMAKENFAILYLTEQLSAQLQPEIARYQDALTPAIRARRAPWALGWPTSRPPWSGRWERTFCEEMKNAGMQNAE